LGLACQPGCIYAKFGFGYAEIGSERFRNTSQLVP